jgi:hypothetical protein
VDPVLCVVKFCVVGMLDYDDGEIREQTVGFLADDVPNFGINDEVSRWLSA